MSRRPRQCVAVIGLAAGMLLVLASQSAAQNVALGRPIIDGSSSWNGVLPGAAPHNGGSFPTSKVTDGITFEGAGAAETYWLGKEGGAPEYFTLDLQAVRNLDEIRLYNTHNRGSNDRGTDEFVLYAGNTIDAMNHIVDEVPILAGNLSDVRFQDNIVPNVFTAGGALPAGLQARYLRFEALSAIPPIPNPPPACCFSVGLNEIEVIDLSFSDPNLAAGKPIIDGSGSWPDQPFNGANFPASRVNDSSPGTYWLGRELVPAEFLTLDLLNVRNIQEIRLFNTSNGASNDRGTRNFRILASETVDASNQLVNPRVILESRLPNVAGLSSPLDMVFTDDNGLIPGNARYLRYESLSAYYDGAGTGLAEIEVYSTEMHAPSQLLREGNIAAGKPVIGGGGAWGGVNPGTTCIGEPFNGGRFPAARVTDESLADTPNQTGRESYWLARDSCPGDYFTLDLQGLYKLDEIVLQNAHNGGFNDRGTGEFVIYGSQSVDAANELVDEFPVLAGELPSAAGSTVIPEEGFLIATDLPPVQYLKFVALTANPPLVQGAWGGAGLNEIEVYGTFIPEPSSWALAVVGVLAAGGMAARRRARRQRE